MKNRHSLLTYISLFFVALLVVLNALLLFQYYAEKGDIEEDVRRRFGESMRMLENGRHQGVPIFRVKREVKAVMGVEVMEMHSLSTEEAEFLQKSTPFYTFRTLRAHRKDTTIYIHLDDKHRGVQLMLRYTDDNSGKNYVVWYALIINFAVISFFLFVISRLWPLRKLHGAITQFSEGNLSVKSDIKGKDEIAQVSHAFDTAIGRIKHLQASRNLFLRNIMHELKTPIAKGKLIASVMDDTKNKERLSVIFDRFETLIGEFAKIERVTSDELDLNIKPFRTVDILDNALDILMVECDAVGIRIEEESEVSVDYELFSIALKNLIDNAFKYGTSQPIVKVYKGMIDVISCGEALESVIFERVFNRKFEDSAKGLGLGLYITKAIVEKHGFELNYLHVKGENHFQIVFHKAE